MTARVVGATGPVRDPEAVLGRAALWARSQGVEVTLADARSVFGADHAMSAAIHAVRAMREKSLSSRTVSMETLLYLAGQRQVTDAIRVAGIRKDSEAIAIVIHGDVAPDGLLVELEWSRDDRVLGSEGKSLAVLGTTAREAATVPRDRRPDLALERVAVLDVNK